MANATTVHILLLVDNVVVYDGAQNFTPLYNAQVGATVSGHRVEAVVQMQNDGAPGHGSINGNIRPTDLSGVIV